jgi:hypothetical protein
VSKMTRRKNVVFVEVTDHAVWDVTVKSDGHIIGHIFRVGELYAYYPGSFNAFTAAFDDSNLERLKERIVAMP